LTEFSHHSDFVIPAGTFLSLSPYCRHVRRFDLAITAEFDGNPALPGDIAGTR